MGLLDVLRAAVPLAAAARGGWLQGEQNREDRQIQLDRQSALDKINADWRGSEIDANRARARNYDAATADRGSGGVWKLDNNGEYVWFPTHPRQQGAQGGAGGTASSTGSPFGDFKAALTGQDLERGLNPPTTTTTSAPSPASTPLDAFKSALGQPGQAAQQSSQQSPQQGGLTIASGVHGRVPQTKLPTKPDKVGDDGFFYRWDDATKNYIKTNLKAPAKAYEFAPKSGGANGPGSTLDDQRKMKLYQSVAQEAVKAADRQISPMIRGQDRLNQRQQLAVQWIQANPMYAPYLNKGLGSQQIVAANEAFGETGDRAAQARASTNANPLERRQYEVQPNNVFAPSAPGALPTGMPSIQPPVRPQGNPTGDINLGDTNVPATVTKSPAKMSPTKPTTKQQISRAEFDQLKAMGHSDAEIRRKYSVMP